MTGETDAMPVIFGEVLFDCFPDGNSVLGGAPFNVAWHLQAFGLSPLMVSSIGDDKLGDKVRTAMQDWSMSTAGLQLDPVHPTGSVDIEFDNGEPSYTIVEQRAYDHISAELLPSLPENSLLYHGTLALRNPVSRQALTQLKSQHSGTLFMDVNLREPWWDRKFVLQMVDDADWVKLNQDELILLGNAEGAIETQAGRFKDTYRLKGLIVTLGASGALALTDDGDPVYVEPSHTLDVVDTVGAGDAFTSVLILGITSGWPLDITMQRAQKFASMIVGQQGATVHNHEFYRALKADWDI